MTEVPDYLLERSRERRRALGLGGDDAGDGGGGEAAAAPAEVEGAAPVLAAPVDVPAEPEPEPEPPAPWVEAAMRRKRVPWWAVPVLVGLPIWAFVYATTLEAPAGDESDPFVLGANVYAANCASCHGGVGEGGVGPELADGSVVDTFGDPADQIDWVTLGSASAEGGVYGDNNTASMGGMPAFGEVLSPEELIAVVLHERSTLSGEEPNEALIDEGGLLILGPEGEGEGEAAAGGE